MLRDSEELRDEAGAMRKPPPPRPPNRKARRAPLQPGDLARIAPGVKLALLFGAGASYGYTPTPELNPPLGAKLFAALKEHCPTWRTAEMVQLFEDGSRNFEAAMAELCERTAELDRTKLLRLTHELCEYLASFRVQPNGRNYYAGTIRLLMGSNRIRQTLFCTLNYDCILDETLMLYFSAHSREHAFTQLWHVLWPKDCVFPLPNPSLLKIHGSVNYFAQGVDLMGATFGSSALPMDNSGPREISGAINTLRLGDTLRAHYSEATKRDSWCLPFIAHYAPGKPPHLNARLRILPDLWQSWVADSAAVIMIGVATESDDPHLWSVFQNWSGHVYDVNPNASERLRGHLGDRYHHLPGKFVDAVDRYLPQLL